MCVHVSLMINLHVPTVALYMCPRYAPAQGIHKQTVCALGSLAGMSSFCDCCSFEHIILFGGKSPSNLTQSINGEYSVSNTS